MVFILQVPVVYRAWLMLQALNYFGRMNSQRISAGVHLCNSIRIQLCIKWEQGMISVSVGPELVLE